MRKIERKFIPGTKIFYINSGIPHTATITSYDGNSGMYEIKDKSFIDTYEDDFGYIDMKCVKCVGGDATIFLPKYPTKADYMFYTELIHGNTFDTIYKSIPKRTLYREYVSERTPLIELEHGMVVLVNDNNSYYLNTSTPITMLIDIHDENNIKYPNWTDHDMRVKPMDIDPSLIVNESNINRIFTFNEYMGENTYDVLTPIMYYWNTIFIK